MISRKNLITVGDEAKDKVNEFVEEFIHYLYGEELTDWYRIGDVGSVASIGDMFFGLEDMFIYSQYTPDEINDMYLEYIDVSDKMSLSAFIKQKQGTVDKQEPIDLDKVEEEFKEFVNKSVAEELADHGIMVTIFIKSKKTGNILYSKYPGDFQCEYNNGEVTIFIDQSLYYTRIGGTEGVDFEILDKPIKERINLRCDDGKYKWISEMNDKDIAFQLSKKYCDRLKNILKS